MPAPEGSLASISRTRSSIASPLPGGCPVRRDVGVARLVIDAEQQDPGKRDQAEGAAVAPTAEAPAERVEQHADGEQREERDHDRDPVPRAHVGREEQLEQARQTADGPERNRKPGADRRIAQQPAPGNHHRETRDREQRGERQPEEADVADGAEARVAGLAVAGRDRTVIFFGRLSQRRDPRAGCWQQQVREPQSEGLIGALVAGQRPFERDVGAVSGPVGEAGREVRTRRSQRR